MVPLVVLNELEKLSKIQNKKQDAIIALEFAHSLKTISITGKFADYAIMQHVRKSLNGSVISFSNDKIVLES